MKKFVRNLMLLVTTAFVFNSAFALTTTPSYSIKNLNPTGSYTGVQITGAAQTGNFTQSIEFSLAPGTIAASLNTVDLSFLGFNTNAISNLSLMLYSMVSGSNVLLGSGSGFTVASAQTGTNYLAVISGTAAAGPTSIYQATFTSFPGSISAVPEPETYAMLLAGLAIVGGIAYRKRANS